MKDMKNTVKLSSLRQWNLNCTCFSFLRIMWIFPWEFVFPLYRWHISSLLIPHFLWKPGSLTQNWLPNFNNHTEHYDLFTCTLSALSCIIFYFSFLRFYLKIFHFIAWISLIIHEVDLIWKVFDDIGIISKNVAWLAKYFLFSKKYWKVIMLSLPEPLQN